MSETGEVAGRDARSGRFLAGNNGGGRKPGSRSKLGEAFVADLAACWEKHGVEALERCALEEPGQFIKVIASLMPRDINLSVGIDPASFADKYQAAMQLLGNEPEPLPPRRHLRELMRSRAIEHKP